MIHLNYCNDYPYPDPYNSHQKVTTNILNFPSQSTRISNEIYSGIFNLKTHTEGIFLMSTENTAQSSRFDNRMSCLKIRTSCLSQLKIKCKIYWIYISNTREY